MAAEARRIPWLRVVVGVVVSAFALYLPYANNVENNTIFSQVMYLAVAAMGLNLLTGFNGQVSLGHGALVAIGAYAVALLTVDHQSTFWPAAAAKRP